MKNQFAYWFRVSGGNKFLKELYQKQGQGWGDGLYTRRGVIKEQPRRPRRQSWNLGRNQRQSVESHNIFFKIVVGPTKQAKVIELGQMGNLSIHSREKTKLSQKKEFTAMVVKPC